MAENDPLPLLIEVNRSRAAAAGIDVYHYDAVTHAIAGLGAWPAAFEAEGQKRLHEATRAQADNRNATAAVAFADAARWLHFATCVPSNDRDAVADLLSRSSIAHRRALRLTNDAAEYFDANATGGQFTAILERPEGILSPAVVLVVPGLDSSKVEFAPIAAMLRSRGLATLRIDGPAQGEMLATSTLCAQYETVVAAAVDLLHRQPNLDASRIGIIGLSLGGYYVPRAISFERRIAAAVAVTGVFAFQPWQTLAPMIRQILTLRAGTEETARAFAASVDLAAVAPTIQQPLLVVGGGKDPVVPVEDCRRLASAAPRGEYFEVAEGDHLCANRQWLWQAQATDWLATQVHRADISR
jgi:dienelactone hydrolase